MFKKSSDIRRAFLEFFEQQGHQIVPSSALVPANDATLLFTNAGMVQFKETFLGLEPRAYVRAASSQRCVRAGGKHNDLENVGYTARHHTFFEMLGNFSFGDYFKREAIRYAWTFLTEVLRLPPERLWVTVFETDDEAANIWLNEIGVSPDRFSRCGEKDNFWSMGDTGPCGPCTEIFYDHGPDIWGGPPGSPDADGDRYIEIWNLVFMQYNRDKSGELHPLPKPSVDTGMGLERIAAIMQGVHNNYDIDIFVHLIHAIHRLLPDNAAIAADNPSFKVIADHIRSCSFLIMDGVLPSNEGRGYVLRRIIRRAVRHGHQLGLPALFFSQLVAPLIEVMGDAYPYLAEKQSEIERILLQEEQQFGRTLSQGLRLFQEVIAKLENAIIPGDVAFKLYDTYGFPIDLTADLAREGELTIDMPPFEECMQKQRAQSQQASTFSEDYSNIASCQETSDFVGYTEAENKATILACFVDGKPVAKIDGDMQATLILDKTPFYAESGGQVGDRGFIFSLDKQTQFRVEDTQVSGQAIIHHGQLQQGLLEVGQSVVAAIDTARRQAIRLNHTATHLLHAALKKGLGKHVQQKGSLVDAERARFDFSHGQALTSAELHTIEALVNSKILENIVVKTEEMPMQHAIDAGAVALFGEKYNETVRVLSVDDFSKELCGGTHVRQTGDIGLFKIVSEYGVASGVRRIEFVTGMYAYQWMNTQLSILTELTQQLKTTSAEAPAKLNALFQEMKTQQTQLEALKKIEQNQQAQGLQQAFQSIGSMRVLIHQVQAMDANDMRTLIDQLKSKEDRSVIVLISVNEQKIHVIASVHRSLLPQVPSAPALVKQLCGRGGGRDDMAQGGGDLPADLNEKIQQLLDLLAVSQ